MAKHLRPVSPIWGSALRKAMESSRDRDLRTQIGLARKSGVAQSTMGRILRGEVNPATDHLQRLAEALKIPLATLLDGPQPEAAQVVNEILANIELGRRKLLATELLVLAFSMDQTPQWLLEELLLRFKNEMAQWRKEAGL